MKKHLLKSLLAVALLLVCGNVWGADVIYQPCTSLSDIAEDGSYIIAISDGTKLYAVQQNSTNFVTITPESNGTIKNPSSSIVWTAGSTTTENGYTFACNDKYIYTSGSNTTLSATGLNPTTWLVSFLNSGYFKLSHQSTGGRYLGWSGSKFAAYANSNFKNQFDEDVTFGQYSGALTIYKNSDDTVTPTKEDAGLAYATTEVSKVVSDDNFTNPLNNPNGLTVTYSSSNEKVATVAATGEVTIAGEGQTTIKASFAGNDTYKAGDASYVLTVADPNVSSVTFTFNTTDGLSALGIETPKSSAGTNLGTESHLVDPITMTTTDGGTATRVWNSSGNFDLRIYKEGGSLTFAGATITKVEFEGTTYFTTGVGSMKNNVWTGSAESVTFTATGTNKITTIKVSYIASSVKVVANIEVSDMKTTFEQNDDFEFGGTVTAYFEDGSNADVTSSASFSGYDMSTAGVQTVTVTYKEKTANYAITVKEAGVYANLAELVAAGEPTTSGKTVTVTLADEEIKSVFVTSTGHRNGIFLQVGDREIEVFCYDVPEDWMAGGTVSGTLTCLWQNYKGTWELCPTSWDDLEYTAPAPVTFTVTLNSNGFATYANANPTNIVSGAKAYTATECVDGVVSFEEVEGAMCGSRGFLLQGEPNATVTIEYVATADVVNSILWGFTVDTAVSTLDAENYDWYGLKGNQFLKLDGGTVKAGKAALRVKKGTEANALSFRFGGTTMVEQMLKENEDVEIYDLLGRKVENATKGIYIIGGKKVMVK